MSWSFVIGMPHWLTIKPSSQSTKEAANPSKGLPCRRLVNGYVLGITCILAGVDRTLATGVCMQECPGRREPNGNPPDRQGTNLLPISFVTFAVHSGNA